LPRAAHVFRCGLDQKTGTRLPVLLGEPVDRIQYALGDGDVDAFGVHPAPRTRALQITVFERQSPCAA
jgi:hypothetical protein